MSGEFVATLKRCGCGKSIKSPFAVALKLLQTAPVLPEGWHPLIQYTLVLNSSSIRSRTVPANLHPGSDREGFSEDATTRSCFRRCLVRNSSTPLKTLAFGHEV